MVYFGSVCNYDFSTYQMVFQSNPDLRFLLKYPLILCHLSQRKLAMTGWLRSLRCGLDWLMYHSDSVSGRAASSTIFCPSGSPSSKTGSSTGGARKE